VHDELLVPAFGITDCNGSDLSGAWSALCAIDDFSNCFGTAVHNGLHTAIKTIAHPAFDVQQTGLVLDVVAVAHALHVSAHYQMPGNGLIYRHRSTHGDFTRTRYAGGAMRQQVVCAQFVRKSGAFEQR